MRFFELLAVMICGYIIGRNSRSEWLAIETWELFAPYAAIPVITYIGAQVEGVRFAQILYLLGFFFSTIWVFLYYYPDYTNDTFRYIMDGIFGLFYLYYFYLGLLSGWGNLSRFNSSGPYQVGTRVIRTVTSGVQVITYYPVSEEEYDEKIGDNNLPYTLGEDINKFIEGVKLEGLPGWLGRANFRLNTNTAENATLSGDFSSGKQLVPIIFFHGYLLSASQYTCTCRELASYGYIVFAIAFTDGSAPFVATEDGQGVYYDDTVDIDNIASRTDKLDYRQNQAVELQTELVAMTSGSSLYTQIFGEVTGASLDMTRLSIAGHSFGGGAAIQTAQFLTSSQVHACLLNDPEVVPYDDQILGNSFPTDFNLLINCSSEYYDTSDDTEVSNGQLYPLILDQNTAATKEFTVFTNFHHLEMTDWSYLNPLLIRLTYGQRPRTDMYAMLAKKWIKYLNFLDVTGNKYVDQEFLDQINEEVQEYELDGNLDNIIELPQLKLLILQ